jgi:hypothetical protein
MRYHTIELSEDELRMILSAFDILRGEAGPLPAAAETLYERLLHTGESVKA